MTISSKSKPVVEMEECFRDKLANISHEVPPLVVHIANNVLMRSEGLWSKIIITLRTSGNLHLQLFRVQASYNFEIFKDGDISLIIEDKNSFRRFLYFPDHGDELSQFISFLQRSDAIAIKSLNFEDFAKTS